LFSLRRFSNSLGANSSGAEQEHLKTQNHIIVNQVWYKVGKNIKTSNDKDMLLTCFDPRHCPHMSTSVEEEHQLAAFATWSSYHTGPIALAP